VKCLPFEQIVLSIHNKQFNPDAVTQEKTCAVIARPDPTDPYGPTADASHNQHHNYAHNRTEEVDDSSMSQIETTLKRE
jgi:hypothetical protein